MKIIEPNTLCYLVEVEDYPDFNGQVVTVLGRVRDPDDPTGVWYSIEAHWLRKFNDTSWTAKHSCLKPLYPATVLQGVEAPDKAEA